MGADFARRLTPLACSSWTQDPFAQGSYSHARIGHADARTYLAEPVDGRLFFAGEACSTHDFSTAHGAYRTGVKAAKAVLGQS
jgi:monoamine oxidase